MVEALGHGRYVVTGSREPGSGIRRTAFAVRDRGAAWVFIEGRTYVVEQEHATAARHGHAVDDQVALAAPMPATVVAIKIQAGDVVQQGALLIMLEAMKMELPITAPRDGRIRSIGCREGELVQPGVPLLELDTEPDSRPRAADGGQ